MVEKSSAASIVAFAGRCGLRIEAFQRRIVRAIAGGPREIVVLLPRGNGKTALLGLIALRHLVTTEDAHVVVVASSRQQAEHLFAYAQRYARALRDPHIVHRYLQLRWAADPDQPKIYTRSLEVWAADANRLHGLTYSLAIVDELQAHQDDGVYVAMLSGLHKRPGAQLVTISTAGQGADSPLGVLRARALALPSVTRRGAVTEAVGPSLTMLAWELDDDADVDDARQVKRVNPASWVTIEQLRHQREALPDLAYRRFIANQWTERAGHWLPPGAWQAIVDEPEITPGERVWAGVRVGGQSTTTAVAWVTETLHVGVATFTGQDGVPEAGETVRRLAGMFQLAEVALDPWNAVQLAAELERDGLVVVGVPQTDARMVPASERLYRVVVERRLSVPDDPALSKAAADAVARQSRRGWRIDRPSHVEDINALVALAVAVDAAENEQPATELLGWL